MQIPRHIGEYEIVKKIATGGMAEIFVARQVGPEGFAKQLAIKKIHSHLCHNEEFTTMFINEARIASQLNHRNIVHVHDFGEAGGVFYIAMEYVEGMDLKSIYRRVIQYHTLTPIPLCCYIIQDLCAALHYAHNFKDAANGSLGIVHRDISPQNVLVSFAGEVKLTDFGIARVAALERPTDSNTLKGKIAYMSPEQSLGKVVDSRSDIFSLGVVFFEMLTGQRLFYGKTEVVTLDRVRQAQSPAPSSVDPSIPPEIDAIVLKALAKNPEDRYQDAMQMHDELRRFLIDQNYFNQAIELGEFVSALAAFGEDGRNDGATFPLGRAIPEQRLKSVIKQSAIGDSADAVEAQSPPRPLVAVPAPPPAPERRAEAPARAAAVIERESVPAAPPQKPPQAAPSPPGRVARNMGPLVTVSWVAGALALVILLYLTGITQKLSHLISPSQCSLIVTSNVEEALIFLDGAEVGVAGPKRNLFLDGLPRGARKIIGQKKNFKGVEQSVELVEGEHLQVVVYLMPERGGLLVRCNEQGAEVEIDGRKIGKTENPSLHEQWELIVPSLIRGSHDVIVAKGRLPYFWQRVTLTPGDLTIVAAELTNMAPQRVLKITSDAPNAIVVIDAKTAGKTAETGVFYAVLNPGTHDVELTDEHGSSTQAAVIMNATANAELPLKIQTVTKQSPGRLRIVSEPGAEIRVNGAGRGKVPRSGELTIRNLVAGHYVVVAGKEGFQDAQDEAEMSAGETVKLSLPMSPEAQTVDVQVFSIPPGAQARLDEQPPMVTPAIFKDVQEGNHILTVTLDGYDLWHDRVSVSKTRTRIEVPLQKKR